MTHYLDELSQVLKGVNLEDVNKVVSLIRKAKNVYILGNGGSQSIAEHFVVDLVKYGGKRAYSLNCSLVTMAGNDYGYEHSFSWLIDHYANEGDLIIGFQRVESQ